MRGYSTIGHSEEPLLVDGNEIPTLTWAYHLDTNMAPTVNFFHFFRITGFEPGEHPVRVICTGYLTDDFSVTLTGDDEGAVVS
jgi:hypothetical protein